MNIVWSAASVRQLEEVFEYLGGGSARLAKTTRRRILATVMRVGQIPYSGRAGRVEGTREAVVPRSPFIVVYEIGPKAVEILGIWHGARLWPDSF
jgi:toxin ParE1/3/4